MFFATLLIGKLRIPYKELQTSKEEDTWVEAKIHEIGKIFKSIMQDPVFAGSYKHAIEKKRYWSLIGNPNNEKNYIGNFAKHCRIRVHSCPNLNTHVVKEEALKLTQELYESSIGELKYTPDNVRYEKFLNRYGAKILLTPRILSMTPKITGRHFYQWKREPQ